MSDAKLAGVIGWPVGQSLSPRLHSYWLAEHGIAGAYVALAVRPEDFGLVVRALPRAGFAGVSVTVPHKLAAHALCGALDADAEATGAVNTLVFEGVAIRGLNTDVSGFAASLTAAFGADATRDGPVAVLGAGGAARAIVRALGKLGATDIRIANRTRDRADALAGAFGAKAFDWGDWNSLFGDARLVVNATSLGMIGKPALDVALDALPREAAIADIVYNPLETALLARARERGHRVADGLGMLMHQAAPAFAAWFGTTPSVTAALRRVLETALRDG